MAVLVFTVRIAGTDLMDPIDFALAFALLFATLVTRAYFKSAGGRWPWDRE